MFCAEAGLSLKVGKLFPPTPTGGVSNTRRKHPFRLLASFDPFSFETGLELAQW
jgi:hypothetical protein